MEQKRVILLRKAHPATQAMSSAAKPADLNEGEIRRNPGEPSAAEAAASRYNKPRFEWQGLTIAIENPAGSVRRGPGWEVRMRFDYGEILGTMGVDGDPVDVIVGPNLDAPTVYVVHQRRFNDWANYDEDKCCVGFDSQSDAEQAFLSNYTDPRFLGPITALPVDEFVNKVRATLDSPAMVKAHVNAYTRNDGVTVAAHEDSRTKHYQAMFAPSLGIKREDMPQVPSGVKQKFLDELKAAGVSIEEATVDPKTLKPTQSNYKASNMDHLTTELRAGRYDKETRILVSSDGRVLDGHHRWAVMAMEGHQMPIIKIGMPAMELLKVARKFNVENGVEARGTEGGPDKLAKASPLVLFLKAHVGPYLRGGKIVNISGYQGRAARPQASNGQLSLFAPPSVVMGPSPYKGKDPVKDTIDLFDADEHGEMPPARRATREDDQHDQSKMSNNGGMKKDLSPLAQEFTAAYAEDPRGVFLKVRDELRAIASDWSSFSVPAVTFLKEMDADQQEAFVVEHVVPALRTAGWPKPHTKPMADAVWSVADAAWSKKDDAPVSSSVVKPSKSEAQMNNPVVKIKGREVHVDGKMVAKIHGSRDPSGKNHQGYFIGTVDGRKIGFDEKRFKGRFAYADDAKRYALANHADLLPKAVTPAPHPTETTEFKRWFGASKVRNDDGTPKVLYHGTPHDFSEFKPGGADPDKVQSGNAIWLSPDADHQPASHNIGWRGEYREGTNVMPVYVKMERPLLIDDKETMEWARQVFAGGSIEFPQLMPKKWADEVGRDGEYDGIIFDGESLGWGDGTTEYLVFDPKQVKSAIGNSGAFDPEHPDITKAQAPVVVFVKAAEAS